MRHNFSPWYNLLSELIRERGAERPGFLTPKSSNKKLNFPEPGTSERPRSKPGHSPAFCSFIFGLFLQFDSFSRHKSCIFPKGANRTEWSSLTQFPFHFLFDSEGTSSSPRFSSENLGANCQIFFWLLVWIRGISYFSIFSRSNVANNRPAGSPDTGQKVKKICKTKVSQKAPL